MTEAIRRSLDPGKRPGSPRNADRPFRQGERVDADLRGALARHLLGGRLAADIGQTGVALVTLIALWRALPPSWLVGWLATFLVGVGLRTFYRKHALGDQRDTERILRVIRADVWLSAAVWGGLALLAHGVGPVDLAVLLVIFAGLVAAATSTLVADGPAYFGFTGLLLVPLAATLILGGLDRAHLILLLLLSLFGPFMVVAYRRSFGLLRDQILTAARLRQSEREAAQSRDFLNALVSSAPNPIVVVDDIGTVVQANKAFLDVLRIEGEKAKGAGLTELVTATQASRSELMSFLDTVREGARSVVELPVLRHDGRELWLRISGTRGAGTAAGTFVLIAEDVTEQVAARRAMEEARKEAEEAARAKSAFLASMSHEIRTPLNGILGMIEILLDSRLTDAQRDAAEVIRSSGQGLLRILNDILDVSKIEAGELDLEEIDFDLQRTVSETAKVFTAAADLAGNELHVDIGEDVPRFVRGDPTRLRQVLGNLLSNAVKFTEDGDIVLSLRAAPAAPGRFAVRFAVRDTGVGIPEDKREAIFQAFEQADASTTRTHGGTGLGLSISQRLVELMGGHLEVTSEEGRGSEFFFTLELEEPTEPREAERVVADPQLLRGKRVLVVDDNATARRIAAEALARAGVADVTVAEEVESGLAALRGGVREDHPFDAVIVDHMMPLRDGFDFVEEARNDPAVAQVPILMLTSANLAGARERAREAGINGFLSKPVARADLIKALAAILMNVEQIDDRRLVTEETVTRSTKGTRILLAEDNVVNQQVAIALLEKRGYEVVAVPDGAKAVDAVQSSHFDLVLMDIQMPVMDGIEATRAIRALPSGGDLPILALTAHAFAEERERCSQAGMNDFLAKPFKPDDLYEMVERWSPTASAGDRTDPPEDAKMSDDGRTTPPVDIEGFRATMREAGIEEIVDSTLEIYKEEAPMIFERLERAMSSGDAEGVRAEAHSLKSSSGNIRAGRLAELLQQLENDGRAGDLDAAAGTFAAVKEEYRAVMEYLSA